MFISVDVVEKSNFNFKLVWEKTVCALSHLTLCNPMDCSPPGSSVHGFSRQEYWSELPCPPPGDLLDPGIKPRLLHLLHCRWILNSQNHLGSLCVLVMQSCPALCDPMDCSLPGSSVHGIFQARILEWLAMPSSRGSSRPSDQTGVSSLLR